MTPLPQGFHRCITGDIGPAGQDGIAGGERAEDLVQLAAADRVGQGRQDGAGVPLSGAGPGVADTLATLR
ncbi:hypothetical protein GCM10010255_71440 [Streptomyces coeruleofuscus]|uniref:Uncharacterized protein n=1 Tax=Streptomyces coeruleofuscus TaxID=66879 RepID=A0ABP5W632_9ACTN